MCSSDLGTIEMMGTMLAGQPADALYTSVAHAGLLSIGLNCATGPEFMTDHIRSLAEIAETRIKEVRDELNEGDQILVKVLGLDGNKIKLSRRAILKEQREKLKAEAGKS